MWGLDGTASEEKVVEINNASRIYDTEDHTRRIVKEELYNNLKKLMERGEIKLLDDDEVKASLRSIQAEHHKDTGKLHIWGSYSHITEGIIRAAWCSKSKELNIWIHSIKI